MLAFQGAREVRFRIQETLELATGMDMALLLDGFSRDQCPLANMVCTAGPPGGDAGMRRQEGGILRGGMEGNSAMGRG